MQHRANIILICSLLLAGPGGARVYQCTDSSGGVAFQDVPCSRGSLSVLQPVQAAQPGIRASEKRWLRQREQKPRRKARAAPQPDTAQRQARQQEQRCWKKEQQLDKVRARLRRGYKPAQGEKLRRQRRSYEDYLSRYCD
ncbi:MAG: DUF4124 domain-containing protein [Halieaceae bacterium]|jgi:hypothetical protein|nr:DUF4124 domain-containing protein [Halieaceae bacterium]